MCPAAAELPVHLSPLDAFVSFLFLFKMQTLTDPRALLDPNLPFNEAAVQLLDRVVAAMFLSNNDVEVRQPKGFKGF